MRSEHEMLDLVTSAAEHDSRIRGAYLEGSRANPNIPKDRFQDYDVVYIVNETNSFREDKSWINQFGERLYMQVPEENSCYPSDAGNHYGWLMQFTDGNRLDLHVSTWEHARNAMEQYIVLVDKDHRFPQKQMLSDEMYWVKKPSQEQFSFACNEFWWCLNNAAKGLWRREIPYVMDSLNFNIRPMLRRLLEWKIGAEHNFSVNVGKSAKYMNKYLPDAIYHQYLQTYSPPQINAIWESVFIMCDLFDMTARELGGKLSFTYDLTEASNSRRYLNNVKELPGDNI